MTPLIAILTFVPIIGVLVFVHELGHFLTAKAFGVKVLEFGFGFPPRLFGVKRGETIYSINWVPLGGFVKMVGENDPADPRSLARRSLLQRFVVLFAGAFMNLLLPIVLFSVLLMIPRTTVVGSVQIQQVVPDSPAERAGLKAGDTILKADGHTIRNIQELVERINLRLGGDSEWVVRRSGPLPVFGNSPDLATTEVIHVTPRLAPPSGQGPTGIMLGMTGAKETSVSYPFWKAIPMSFVKIYNTLILSKNEVMKWIVGHTTPQVAGPVGIAQLTGEVAEAGGFLSLVELAAFLSINLAIINVLPIPMLDGGRLLFLGIEWVRRGKRVPPEKEGLVHMVGFVVLIGFIILISYFDIARIIQGESLFK